MTANESLGQLLAAVFQPVAPLLALVFAVTLLRRRLSAYWSVVVYFLIISVYGGLVYFLKLDRNPPLFIGYKAAELAVMGLIAWQLAQRSFISYPSLAAFATKSLWRLLPVCAILAVVTLWTDPDLVPGR